MGELCLVFLRVDVFLMRRPAVLGHEGVHVGEATRAMRGGIESVGDTVVRVRCLLGGAEVLEMIAVFVDI